MTDTEAEYWRVLQLLENGNFHVAAPRLATLVANTTDARFHASYGICLQMLGRWLDAIAQFEAALALRPAYCEADWRNLLAASYLADARPRDAIEQWRIVADMEPAYPSRGVPIDEAKRMLERHK